MSGCEVKGLIAAPRRSRGLCVLALLCAAPAIAAEFRVDCQKGDAIGKALAHAAPGDTIRVSGTCRERVTISTDRVTLDGQERSVIDGGGGTPTEFAAVVTIGGARGVTISGFTIRNGSAEGVLAVRGATFSLRRSIVEGHPGTGIAVGDGATAELTDCSVRRNGAGIDTYGGSAVILRGTIGAQHNASNGLTINGHSLMDIRGAKVLANDNAAFGLVVSGSRAIVFGFSESAGSAVTANRNGIGGIVVTAGSLETSGVSTITAANNGTNGIIVPLDGWLISPFGSGTFNVHHNPVGITFGHGSGAVLAGGLRVESNGTLGLVADGAGVLTLGSTPENPSHITGNGTDVSLAFGSRVTFDGVSVGTLTCDATALSRGTTLCPVTAR